MERVYATPKEGELYKTVEVGGHRFELRFGFYAEFERQTGEPVVIYPDLTVRKLYTEDGKMLVTAIQDPCPHYKTPGDKTKDACCCDCEYYLYSGDDIGICACAFNNKTYPGRDPIAEQKPI